MKGFGEAIKRPEEKTSLLTILKSLTTLESNQTKPKTKDSTVMTIETLKGKFKDNVTPEAIVKLVVKNINSTITSRKEAINDMDLAHLDNRDKIKKLILSNEYWFIRIKRRYWFYNKQKSNNIIFTYNEDTLSKLSEDDQNENSH